MKKYALYILIFLIFVGLFSPLSQTLAQTQTPPVGKCTYPDGNGGFLSANTTQDACGKSPYFGTWEAAAANNPTTAASAPQSEFTGQVLQRSCGIVWNLEGCLVKFSYYVFYSVPALLLAAAAKFFNILIGLTIGTALYTKSTFIPTAWAVVRDLSNLFFILVLLYIAIQLILDLGGHDAKKMIIKVIIIGLLINFSMFFTEVIIDTSNILALVFYNKLDVNTSVSVNGQDPINRPYTESTESDKKDISGAMVNAFDPTSALTWNNFFAASRNLKPDGTVLDQSLPIEDNTPTGLTVAMILISGAVMAFAAYAFFVAGLSFVGRLIELWILIVFSPFAFMSSTISILEKVDYIGWDAWLKRLLSVSFMAPIFMFFMYFIFLILRPPSLFGNLITRQGLIETILLFTIPAVVILILLMKATEFAKKGSGVLGEKLISGAKMVGGLALGAATGGAAMLATGTLGNLASRAASSKFLNENQNKKGLGGMAARMALKTADYGTKASFDVRNIPGAKALAKAGGLNLESASVLGLGAKEGGYAKRRADTVKKRQERAKQLEVREDEGLKQNLNKTEMDLQSLLNKHSGELAELDKIITKRRENLSDVTARFGGGSAEAKQAGLDLQNAKDKRKALKDGANYAGDKDLAGVVTGANAKNYNTADYAAGVDPVTGARRTMNHMEDIEIRDRKQAIVDENRARKVAYAERLQNRRGALMGMSKAAGRVFLGSQLGVGATLGLGALGFPVTGAAAAAGIVAAPLVKEDKRANREAAHKIIMEVKLDSGEKH